MTPEEQAAADQKEAAEFEATLANLPPAEQEQKRKEHAAQNSDKQRDKELDEELKEEAERKRVADEAFRKREEMRKEREKKSEEGEGDKVLDSNDIVARATEAATAAATKVALQSAALTIARSLAASDKEAQLIVAKWGNRSFPDGVPLQDQVEEMYAVVNRKKLIGERNEALRVARNKGNVNDNGAATHRDAPAAGEPKLSDADASALKAAGFVWDGDKRMYKKPLKGGKLHLYRDSKSGRTFTGV